MTPDGEETARGRSRLPTPAPALARAAVPAPAPKADDPAQRVMWEVRTVLDEDRHEDAARMFVEALQQHALPAEAHQLQWLVTSIGQETTRKLIDAFAHFACFYCRHGLEPCELCAGTGMGGEQNMCEACIGFGLVPCEFCSGSGLATYSFIPPGLRFAVLRERSRLAIHALGRVLQEPIPTASEPDAGQKVVRRILSINKLLGALENAVIAAEEIQRERSHPPEALQDVIASCRRGAAAAEALARSALLALSTFACQAVQTRPEDAAPDPVAQRKAEFYRALAQSPHFENTPLAHPAAQERTRPA